MDWSDFVKVCGIAAAAFGFLGTAALFVIRSIIRQNNDRLLDRLDSRYLKRELYEERDRAAAQKLDLIHTFQKDRSHMEMDRFDELADMVQAVHSGQESHNVRLTVIETRLVMKRIPE